MADTKIHRFDKDSLVINGVPHCNDCGRASGTSGCREPTPAAAPTGKGEGENESRRIHRHGWDLMVCSYTDDCIVCMLFFIDYVSAAPVPILSLSNEQQKYINDRIGRIFYRAKATEAAYFKGNCGMISPNEVLTAAHILPAGVEPKNIFVLVGGTLYHATVNKNLNDQATILQLRSSSPSTSQVGDQLGVVDVCILQLVGHASLPHFICSPQLIPPPLLTTLYRVAFLPPFESRRYAVDNESITIVFNNNDLSMDSDNQQLVQKLSPADIQVFQMSCCTQLGTSLGLYDGYRGVSGAMILNSNLEIVGVHNDGLYAHHTDTPLVFAHKAEAERMIKREEEEKKKKQEEELAKQKQESSGQSNPTSSSIDPPTRDRSDSELSWHHVDHSEKSSKGVFLCIFNPTVAVALGLRHAQCAPSYELYDEDD